MKKIQNKSCSRASVQKYGATDGDGDTKLFFWKINKKEK